MIITCEQCHTRFQLDETRIPARGARVRCSRCKHAFLVAHPMASHEDAIADVVAEATDRAAFGAPEAAADLPGPGETDPLLSGSLGDLSDAGGGAQEDYWEFNEEPVAEEPAQERRLEVSQPDASAAPPDTDLFERESGFSSDDAGASDEMGSPEAWDLLRPQGPPAQPGEVAQLHPALTAPQAEEPAATSGVPPERRRESGRGRKAAAERKERAPTSAFERPAAPVSPTLPARLAAAAGWGLVLLLLGAGLAGGLRPLAGAPVSASPARTAEVLGLEARKLSGQFVENAHEGFLFVVSGELVSDPDALWSAYGTLEAQLLAADGLPLPQTHVAAAGPLPEEVLRERPFQEIRQAQEERAQALLWPPLLPGERRPFQAVFENVPDAAVDFGLRGIALPPPAS